MEKAKKFISKVFVLLLAVGVLALVWSFFFDRGGSEISFEAVITAISPENIVTADVIIDGDSSFTERRLPPTVRFSADTVSDELEVGDRITALDMEGTQRGDFLKVVSLSVQETP